MSSKGVGMVRRMDELGRVVIPKEVRKSFRISNHEPLEILVDGDDTIVLRKYHSRPDMENLAQEYAETLHRTFGQPVMVDDSENIIAVAGLSKKEFVNKPIPEELSTVLATGAVDITPSDKLPFSRVIIESFSLSSKTQGRFIMLARTADELGEAEARTISTAAAFLSKWLEKNR